MYRWTQGRIQAEANRFSCRSDFRAHARLAYNAAQRWNLLDAVCSHMERKPHPLEWTRRRIDAEALRYSYRGDFKAGSPQAYNAARRMGVLDAVCFHMGRRRSGGRTKPARAPLRLEIVEELLKWAVD